MYLYSFFSREVMSPSKSTRGKGQHVTGDFQRNSFLEHVVSLRRSLDVVCLEVSDSYSEIQTSKDRVNLPISKDQNQEAQKNNLCSF